MACWGPRPYLFPHRNLWRGWTSGWYHRDHEGSRWRQVTSRTWKRTFLQFSKKKAPLPEIRLNKYHFLYWSSLNLKKDRGVEIVSEFVSFSPDRPRQSCSESCQAWSRLGCRTHWNRTRVAFSHCFRKNCLYQWLLWRYFSNPKLGCRRIKNPFFLQVKHDLMEHFVHILKTRNWNISNGLEKVASPTLKWNRLVLRL